MCKVLANLHQCADAALTSGVNLDQEKEIMPTHNCTVCKNDKGFDKPCQVISVGEEMEHLDLCVITGEFGVADFKRVD